jgi:hypothetical protein
LDSSMAIDAISKLHSFFMDERFSLTSRFCFLRKYFYSKIGRVQRPVLA